MGMRLGSPQHPVGLAGSRCRAGHPLLQRRSRKRSCRAGTKGFCKHLPKLCRRAASLAGGFREQHGTHAVPQPAPHTRLLWPLALSPWARAGCRQPKVLAAFPHREQWFRKQPAK